MVRGVSCVCVCAACIAALHTCMCIICCVHVPFSPLNNHTHTHTHTHTHQQALRTLFNIAHRLHATLGPSWVLILDTLHALDRLLLSPSTTTQELSSDASNSSRPSDLMILSTAATQLYESTAGMDDAAVLSLFMGLRVTSQRALSFGAMQPGGPVRLFAVGRMVEVLQHNRHRLPDLWKVFVAHVGEILTNSTVRPAVRGAAADALGRAISVLLTTPPPVQHAAGGWVLVGVVGVGVHVRQYWCTILVLFGCAVHIAIPGTHNTHTQYT